MNTKNITRFPGGNLLATLLLMLVAWALPQTALADYATNCSTCHGALATSAKLGRTAAQIQSAINSNTGGMGALSFLTPAQIDGIAVQLGSPSTCVSPSIWDTTGNVCGAPPPCTLPQVDLNGVCQIPPPTCTPPQILQGNVCVDPTPTCASPLVFQNGVCVLPPAADNYTPYCAYCHGPVTNSQVKGMSFNQIKQAIHGGVPEMNIPSLLALTNAQIDGIAVELGRTTTCLAPKVWDVTGKSCVLPPTCTAPQVLEYNVCLDPTPLCTSPLVLQGNICVDPTPTCTPPQVLQNGVCVTPPPATLYAANCAICHNPLATTTKLGRTAAQIQNAISLNAGGMMGVLNTLTAQQIDSIAVELGSPSTCVLPAVWDSTGMYCGIPSQTCTPPAVLQNGVCVTPPAPVSLYELDCAGCHNPLATSTKLGRTAAQIQSAITLNAGGVMSALNTLTAQQIDSIAVELGSPSTCVPPNVWDSTGMYCGIPSQTCTPPAVLQNGVCVTPPAAPTVDYAAECSSCHNPLATTTKPGRTAAQIQNAINLNAGGVMGVLNTLTAQQIDSIAVELGSPSTCVLPAVWDSTGMYCGIPSQTCTPPAVLQNGVCVTPPAAPTVDYAAECSSCHNPLATTTKPGRTAAQIQNAINLNAGGVMGVLNTLTAQQIDSIAVELGSPSTCVLPAVWDSTGMYCGIPSQTCTPPAVLQNGVCVTPPVAPTVDYAAECSSCHNPLATTTKPGRTAAQIQNAITLNAGSVMGALNTLTSQQIDSIAVELGSPSTCLPPNVWDSTGMYCGIPSQTCTPPAVLQNGVCVTPPAAPTVDYATECSSCHNPLATTTKLGRTAAQIQNAITFNAGTVMGSLSSLTAQQIDSIAVELGSPSTCLPPNVWDSTGMYCGIPSQTCTPPAVLQNGVCVTTPAAPTVDYAAECSSCHNPLATTTKPGRTAAQIQNAINLNAGGVMGSLSILTAQQIDSIAVELGSSSTCVPPNVWDSTGMYCGIPSQTCTPPAVLQNGVCVTPPPVAPTVDYAAECSSCHNPLATTTKPGRTAAQIQNAINLNAGGVMGSLSSLTAQQIDSIAVELGSSSTCVPPNVWDSTGMYCGIPSQTCTPPAVLQNGVCVTPPPVAPTVDYAAECSSCHNPLATTTKPGRTAAQIQNAITLNAGGVMGVLNTLTAQQIDSIAVELGSPSTCVPPNVWDSTGMYCGIPSQTCTPPAVLQNGVCVTPPAAPTVDYAAECSSCHNPLATTTKPGRTAAQIQNAINLNAGGVMGVLNSLTAQQIDSIAVELGSPSTCVPPNVWDSTGMYCGIPSQTCTPLAVLQNGVCVIPPAPVSLYELDCAGCHNPLATTTKPGRTAAQIQTAITLNAGSVMGSLSSLTAQQIDSIAVELGSVTVCPAPKVWDTSGKYCGIESQSCTPPQVQQNNVCVSDTAPVLLTLPEEMDAMVGEPLILSLSVNDAESDNFSISANPNELGGILSSYPYTGPNSLPTVDYFWMPKAEQAYNSYQVSFRANETNSNLLASNPVKTTVYVWPAADRNAPVKKLVVSKVKWSNNALTLTGKIKLNKKLTATEKKAFTDGKHDLTINSGKQPGGNPLGSIPLVLNKKMKWSITLPLQEADVPCNVYMTYSGRQSSRKVGHAPVDCLK